MSSPVWSRLRPCAFTVAAFACLVPTAAIAHQPEGRSDALRLCLDLEDIDGPDWRPVAPATRGDPIVSEVALRMARRLLTDPEARIFATHELYDALGPRAAATSMAELVRCTHYLRGHVAQSQSNGSFVVRLSLDGVVTDDHFEVMEQGRLPVSSKRFGELVARLLRERGAALRQGDAFLGDYARFPFQHHLSNAEATFYRLLGRRYGEGSEARLLQRAASYLEDRLSPDTAHLDAALEKVELHLRRHNLALGEDDHVARAAGVLDAFSTEGESSARYHLLRASVAQFRLWRLRDLGLATRREVCREIWRELDTARDLDPRLAVVSFRLAFLGYRNVLEMDSQRIVDQLEAAISENPAMLLAYAYLARVLARRGEEARATHWFARLFAIRDHGFGHYLQAEVEQERGDLDAAYSSLIELERSGFYPRDKLLLRALIELRRSEVGKAELSLVTAVAGRQSELTSEYENGLNAADDDSAREQFRGAREELSSRIVDTGKFKRNGDDEILLGLLAARLGERDRARRFAENLRLRFPESDRTSVWVAVATIYGLLGERDYAAAFSDRAWKGMSTTNASRICKAESAEPGATSASGSTALR